MILKLLREVARDSCSFPGQFSSAKRPEKPKLSSAASNESDHSGLEVPSSGSFKKWLLPSWKDPRKWSPPSQGKAHILAEGLLLRSHRQRLEQRPTVRLPVGSSPP